MFFFQKRDLHFVRYFPWALHRQGLSDADYTEVYLNSSDLFIFSLEMQEIVLNVAVTEHDDADDSKFEDSWVWELLTLTVVLCAAMV